MKDLSANSAATFTLTHGYFHQVKGHYAKLERELSRTYFKPFSIKVQLCGGKQKVRQKKRKKKKRNSMSATINLAVTKSRS